MHCLVAAPCESALTKAGSALVTWAGPSCFLMGLVQQKLVVATHKNMTLGSFCDNHESLFGGWGVHGRCKPGGIAALCYCVPMCPTGQARSHAECVVA